MCVETTNDLALLERIAHARVEITTEVGKRIVGQDAVIEHLLIALLARGHCLLQGVPGLAKTLLISTLAESLDLSFSRIQFTPDLMPSDITGTEVLEIDQNTGQRHFTFVKGPVFTHLLLADEINRTSPKTQAALLQAMQEYQVSAGGHTHPLPLPFHVFATQNPIEQEGTYPLPEAQLDRFMFHLLVDYPSLDDEVAIVRRTSQQASGPLQRTLDPESIRALQDCVLRVPVADEVIRYAVALVRATRPDDPSAPAIVKEHLAWGAGPRAAQHLILAAKARAVIHGHRAPAMDDVRAMLLPTLRHRLLLHFQAEAQRITSTQILAAVLEKIAP